LRVVPTGCPSQQRVKRNGYDPEPVRLADVIAYTAAFGAALHARAILRVARTAYAYVARRRG
jgi:hypothetical protein